MSMLDDAFVLVKELTAAFSAGSAFHLSAAYQEAEVRKDYIDKFLIALGWDVNHDRQRNPFEQDVKVERGVFVGAAQKRADYALYVPPNYRDVRLFIEAKKPYGDLASADTYFQVVRYGWNSQTPIAVVTNFAELHILDCRYKPDIESSLERVVRKFHYSQYGDPQVFAEIYYLLSREAVGSGSIEKYAASLPALSGKARQRRLFKPGHQSIDESLVAELGTHRESLARMFKKHNPELDGSELTEITQRVLDRLVFIRFLEDKLIEQQNLVARFGEGGSAWSDFIATSRRLDGVYNGIVFKKHALVDAPSFKVDDHLFGGICEQLSHLNSPYDFNAIPIHVLGKIYEHFLGKTIVVSGNRVSVVDKPEVIKAGGIVYTPEYVTRYIVRETLAPIVGGRSREAVEKTRFADIACGSGSFLLGIYDYLLRHYTKYFNENPSRAKKGDCVEREGALHLTLFKKRQILLNHIFGVDLDPQAVEVAQLSLYLKLLEDETTASAKEYQLTLHEAILPSLKDNVVCGNSVIDSDFRSDDLFDGEETQEKVKPLDIRRRFASVMRAGGFDAIVGNPPYVRIQGFPRPQVEYLSAHYRAATGNFDLFVTFIERAYSLLKDGGRLGQILPNKFFATDYGSGLRSMLSEDRSMVRVVDFGADQVFEVTTYTCLLFLQKKKQETFEYTTVPASDEALQSAQYALFKNAEFGSDRWVFAGGLQRRVLDKLAQGSKPLSEFAEGMNRGSSTGADEAFVLDAPFKGEEDICRVPVFAGDFSRYEFQPRSKKFIIFPYEVSARTAALLPESVIKRDFPQTYEWLCTKRTMLKARKQTNKWYSYSAPRSLERHDNAHFLVPLLARRGGCARLVQSKRNCLMASAGFSLTLRPGTPVSPDYVLALLNSTLLFWYLRQQARNHFRGGWITCTKQYFWTLPIAVPASDDDQRAHDALGDLVRELEEAKRKAAESRVESRRTYQLQRVESLEQAIDDTVYKLYRLGEDEVALIRSEMATIDGAVAIPPDEPAAGVLFAD